VVGLAVLAFPLLATGVAQASLAGATPAQFTGPPNLRSATINATYSNIVEVCYDKTVNNAVAANYRLGGYRAGNLVTAGSAAIDQTNTNCVIVTFNVPADENQYTFVESLAGAVRTNSTNIPSLADSVALTGSTSHSGTTGVTTQPNLVGVPVPDSVELAASALTFVFDKTTHVAAPGDFAFETASGSICVGEALVPSTQDSTTPTIIFNTGGGFACLAGTATNISQAVRAGTLFGGFNVADQDPASPFGADAQWTVLPNCASPCATSRPDVVSTAIGAANDTIVFTYDKNVVVTGTTGAGFFAELANGQVVQATGDTLTGANQVTATFNGDLSNKAEFAVEGYQAFGAPVFASDNITGTGLAFAGTGNIGDNAGAFGSGFTTAPDSFGVTINHTNGQIVVNLDDRISAAPNTGAITLYTAAGLPVAIAPTSVSYNSSAGPGPLAVTLQYSPSGITNVTGVQLNQNTFNGPCRSAGACTTKFSTVAADTQNVPQIDDPPADAAILKAYKAQKAKHQKHHRHLKHHR
jgi:hypothetical protein